MDPLSGDVLHGQIDHLSGGMPFLDHLPGGILSYHRIKQSFHISAELVVSRTRETAPLVCRLGHRDVMKTLTARMMST